MRYAGVYPDADVVYYGNQGHLEYDFAVASGGCANFQCGCRDHQLRCTCPPTGFAATAGNAQVALAWTASMRIQHQANSARRVRGQS